MDTNSLIAQLDTEIAQLEEVRALLSGVSTATPEKEITHPKHKMSKAGRERIAAAQRKRWAKIRKQERKRKKYGVRKPVQSVGVSSIARAA